MSALSVKRAFVGAVEDEFIMYSDRLQDYSIGQPIGFGASSVVYYATFQPKGAAPVQCALKVIDLDILPPNALPLLRRETQLMALSKHPNVLRVRGTWMDGHKLYIALRLMRSGSVADVMRYGWPGGFEEEVIKCVLKQALEGLNYLHVNGFIHRDVKGANLLIDDDGTVLLGDLGVAASLTEDDLPVTTFKRTIHFESTSAAASHRDSSDRGRPRLRHKRKSFVGTPCWMAPEVVSQKNYDSQADMWSFGITALELAQGRPPYSRESSHRVLMKITQDEPPTLDRQGGDQKYSRALKEIVESCLVKDPAKRPTAEQLLASPFFKSAKKKSYLVDKILAGLPPLSERQERRRLPSVGSHSSIGSWDFSHTVHSLNRAGSPTSSVHHRDSISHYRQSSLSLPPNAVFEIEDEDEHMQNPGRPAGFVVREKPAGDKPLRSGEAAPPKRFSFSPSDVSPVEDSSPDSGSGFGDGDNEELSEMHDSEPTPMTPPLAIRTRKALQADASASSGSPSNGGKLWRMFSGRQPKDVAVDDGGGTAGRKGSFSAQVRRVSGMFSSSS
ncbi:kinase-like protein [Auricularia subglabra TFB-10046 SS5]|nr:kinase-like protein [Auricularia subglabra TFB-10046 SS5]